MNSDNQPGDQLESLAQSYFDEHVKMIHCRTDRLFGGLMIVQWLAGIVIAFTISPSSWSGATYSIHNHVYAAIFLGGLITSLPAYLAFVAPGKKSTRHIIGISQALVSALLIHLTGGRIETHFHIFGSLALIAFYRDWPVLISTSVVIAIDHLVRGMFWPESVFGVVSSNHWRWIEHAMWVVFEDVFLICSSIRGVKEMKDIALKHAQLVITNQQVEAQIVERTQELAHREGELQATVNAVADSLITVNRSGKLLSMNRAAERIFGDLLSQPSPPSLFEIINDLGNAPAFEVISATQDRIDKTGEAVSINVWKPNPNGDPTPMEASITAVPNPGEERFYMLALRDTSEKEKAKQAERELHRQQIEIARVAGMSEIATGVLHNVGNALNSVNVSANFVRNSVCTSKIARVNDLAELIRSQDDLGSFFNEDERGKRVPNYLESLGKELSKEQESNQLEMEQLLSHIQHIKAIVATQQSIAKPIGLTEDLSLQAVVDESLGIHIGPGNHTQISIERDYESLPSIEADRSRLMQILFNLISNAKESLRDSGHLTPTISVKICRQDSSHVCVSISDNGIGIEKEKLDRIFAHGFTTKPYGHGFGLHSSANAATEMGGTLSAMSEGPGNGATFKLILPLSREQDAEEAILKIDNIELESPSHDSVS